MKWVIIYFLTLIIFPIGLPLVFIAHILSNAEKNRSKKREKEIENAVTRALSKKA